jgi:alpha-galactosidase
MINISTGKFQILMTVNDKKKLEMLHVGAEILHPQDLLNSTPHVSPWLNKTCYAYPGWGGGTFHEPAAAFQFADGQIGCDLYYISHKEKDFEGGKIWEILLKDSFYPLEITLKYTACFTNHVIHQSVEVNNKGNEPLTIKQAASSFLRLRGREYQLSHLAGGWANENRLVEETLTRGIKVLDSREGVRTTRFQNPAALVSLDRPSTETEGEVLAVVLAYNGNWRLAFEVDDYGDLLIQGGINPYMGDWELEGGRILETPPMILTWSDKGRGEVTRQIHRWVNQVWLTDREEDVPVLLNSWEGAYFNVNHEVLEQFIEDAADIGAGMFVLDDGWFGSGEDARDHDRAGLGDWETNLAKFPQTLRPLAQKANKKGLKFGLWFEPEMVNPQSKLYREHPDWVINNPHHNAMVERFQLLLDLGNPEVEAYVFNILDKYLTEIPEIGYIKWDCNRQITSPGSAYVRKSQTHLYQEYEDAFIRIITKIRKKHPKVLIQACASGGGRINYAVLKYFHEYWTSDNTDPHQRIFMQWGTNIFYPARTTASHVTASPNHQTGRETPLKFRFDVAMTGRLGLELQPSQMTEEEKSFSRKAIKEYNRIRPVIFDGDLYRLQSPYTNPLASIMYVSQNKREAVVFTWLLERKQGDKYLPVKLQGLDENLRYRIKEINPRPQIDHPQANKLPPVLMVEGQDLGGDFLMKVGLTFEFLVHYDSSVVHLIAK